MSESTESSGRAHSPGRIIGEVHYKWSQYIQDQVPYRPGEHRLSGDYHYQYLDLEASREQERMLDRAVERALAAGSADGIHFPMDTHPRRNKE